MGLDTVALIYKIEEEFRIAIPDREAEGMSTIGDICNYIIHRSGATGGEALRIERAVLAIVADHAGVPLEDLRPDMSLTSDLGLD